MKLLIWSDLHLDVGHQTHPFKLPNPMPEFDVLVVAGDIRENMVKGVRWLANIGVKQPIVVVGGNHEMYGRKIDTEYDKAKAEAAKHPNIHVLQNDKFDLTLPLRPLPAPPGEDPGWVAESVRFLGATLFTDYELDGYGWRDIAMMTANSNMSDHRRIRRGEAYGFRKFTARDAASEHLVSKQYLAGMLREPWRGKIVVVTHHAPSQLSIDHRFFGSALNPAYASKLEDLVQQSDLWVHGHVHAAKDYTLGGGLWADGVPMRREGRVIANPRGYASHDEQTGFNPSLVIDTETLHVRPSLPSVAPDRAGLLPRAQPASDFATAAVPTSPSPDLLDGPQAEERQKEKVT